MTDRNGDGRADKFETISDGWGYGNYHEYAFGTKFDPEGNLRRSRAFQFLSFPGFVPRVGHENHAGRKNHSDCQWIEKPGGIGPNEHGALFYIESQGPWNSSCSLKFLKEGGFMGHPVSFNWYEYAKNLKGPPKNPESGGRS